MHDCSNVWCSKTSLRWYSFLGNIFFAMLKLSVVPLHLFEIQLKKKELGKKVLKKPTFPAVMFNTQHHSSRKNISTLDIKRYSSKYS